MELQEGNIYTVTFPFVGDVYHGFDACGPFDTETWRPGCRSEHVYPDDCEFVADAEGQMTLTIISIHKPGKYPERIFYTRKFIDPEGKEFGATKLRMTTAIAFKRRAAGYYHPYRVL